MEGWGKLNFRCKIGPVDDAEKSLTCTRFVSLKGERQGNNSKEK
jgi:hypothetical protein